MTEITQVLQTPSFKNAVKKLHKNQKADLDEAVKALIADPLLGEQKKGEKQEGGPAGRGRKASVKIF